MRLDRRIVVCSVLSLTCGGWLAAQEIPPDIARYRRGLPPLGRTVEFARDGALPPNLVGMSPTTTPLRFTPDPDALDDAAIVALRDAALADPRVREALGEDFVFITGGRAVAEKTVPPTPAEVLVRFYSHSRKRAVDVEMREASVQRVIPRRLEYQPSESGEEIRKAEQVARSDARFPADGAGLFVRGLLTPSLDGNRHLHLLFFKAEGLKRGRAVFESVVDVTAGRVVSARPLAGR